MRQIQVRAPATSANLGPGFDALGLALKLYMQVRVSEEERGEGLVVRVAGEGRGKVPADGRNAVVRALLATLAECRHRPGHIRVEVRSEIPLASGLGSSSAALLAGIAAGRVLAGQRVDREALLEQGAAEEGHPDNVAPCVLGGFVAAVAQEGRVHCARLEPPAGLCAVVAIPDFPLPTARARAVLPDKVSRADAIFNVGRASLLTAALAGGRLDLLGAAMQDRLHELHRSELVPGLVAVEQAALAAGALGAALSGAGPAVLALVSEGGERVGEAMRGAWETLGIEARFRVLEIDREGLQVEGG